MKKSAFVPPKTFFPFFCIASSCFIIVWPVPTWFLSSASVVRRVILSLRAILNRNSCMASPSSARNAISSTSTPSARL